VIPHRRRRRRFRRTSGTGDRTRAAPSTGAPNALIRTPAATSPATASPARSRGARLPHLFEMPICRCDARGDVPRHDHHCGDSSRKDACNRGSFRTNGPTVHIVEVG
jgi:hypothetical protein